MAVWSEINSAQLSISNRLDAEYFKPEYISIHEKLMNLNCIKLRYEALLIKCGPFGSTIKNETYCSEGVTVARPFNIHDCEFQHNNLAFISEEDFKRKNLLECENNDIFFSRVGDVKVGILEKNQTEDVTISPNIVMLRLKGYDLLPEYATIFFNTNLGQKQILRAQKVVAQPTISTSLLNELLVFNPGKKEQKKITNIFNESRTQKKYSEELFIQAQQLLEEELGLENLALEKPKSYESSFSEIVINNRIDPEFFDTKYDVALDIVQKYKNGTSMLKQISKRVQSNFKPSKDVKSYNYLEIGDVNISDGEYITNTISTTELPANAKIKLTGGELLISQVRPTRGAICLIDNVLMKTLICSGAFYVCNLNNKAQSETVFLYLRIMKNIFEKYCGGTSYPTIDSHYLGKFPIPNFSDELTNRISKLIVKAKEARKESEQLLEQAKKRVEELIEGGTGA